MKSLRILLAASLTLLPLPTAEAQTSGCGANISVPMAKETITVSSTAIGPTTATIVTATASANVGVFHTTTAIRSWDDGSTPTDAVGMPWAADTKFVVCGAKALQQLKMIRQASDSTVTAMYYKGE